MSRSGHDTGVPELEPEVFDSAIVPIAMTAGDEHLLVYYNDAFRVLFGPRRLGVPARDAFDEPAAAPFITMLNEVFRGHIARQVTSPAPPTAARPARPASATSSTAARPWCPGTVPACSRWPSTPPPR